jgi:hypothetical protein
VVRGCRRARQPGPSWRGEPWFKQGIDLLIESEQGLAELPDEATGGLLARDDAFSAWRVLLTKTIDLKFEFVGEVDEELVLSDQLVECLPG